MSSNAVFLGCVLPGALFLLGLSVWLPTIPAKIAEKKGQSWWAFYWFGLFFLPFALTTAFLIDPVPMKAEPVRVSSNLEKILAGVAFTATVAVLVFVVVILRGST